MAIRSIIKLCFLAVNIKLGLPSYPIIAFVSYLLIIYHLHNMYINCLSLGPLDRQMRKPKSSPLIVTSGSSGWIQGSGEDSYRLTHHTFAECSSQAPRLRGDDSFLRAVQVGSMARMIKLTFGSSGWIQGSGKDSYFWQFRWIQGSSDVSDFWLELRQSGVNVCI